VQTPAIDSLRRRSTLFSRAYSPIPLTLPAHASLVTGLLPSEHGVRDNSGYILGAEVETLAETLTRRGYRTGASVSSYVLRQATGIAQGFEFYDDAVQIGGRQGSSAERAGKDTLRTAKRWLREVAGEPFFLLVHLYEPHAPYEAPEPYLSRYPESGYDAEIAYTDSLVGGLLDTLRQLDVFDETAIFLVSDHGEGLGDHGEEEHGILLYREALQVPLLMKLPGVRGAGETVAAPVALQDVYSTVLHLAGAGPATGPSLLDPVGGRSLFAETFYPELRLGWSGMVSVIRDEHHYIEGVHGELFDLRSDPGELTDVASANRRTLRDLQRLLKASPRTLERPQFASVEQAERLLSLGYLSGSITAASGRGARLPDPRNVIESLSPYFAAVRLLSQGRADEAKELLRALLGEHPRMLDAWQFLAIAETELNNPEGAYAAYRRAFDLSGGSPVLLKPLSHLTLHLGKVEEAVELLPLAVKEHPRDVPLRIDRTKALLASGKLQAALESARSSRKLLPFSVELEHQLASTLIANRAFEEAEKTLRVLLQSEPGHLPARSDLGRVLEATERWAEAVEVFREVVRRKPSDRVAIRNLARAEQQLALHSRG